MIRVLKIELTVEVAGVLLVLERWDELRLLPQQTVPINGHEEDVLLHLKQQSIIRMSWKRMARNQESTE